METHGLDRPTLCRQVVALTRVKTTSPQSAASTLHAIPSHRIETIRIQMVAFANQHLHDAALAEDAVQEAMAGALRNAASFRGEAALKTWMFAILKNKIVDTIRSRTRESQSAHALDPDDIGSATPFDARGFWTRHERPQRWHNPASRVEDAQFWQIFEACLDHLPPRQSRAFIMREFLELDSAAICDELAITAGNLHVLLHRARLSLRRCLEHNWFAV